MNTEILNELTSYSKEQLQELIGALPDQAQWWIAEHLASRGPITESGTDPVPPDPTHPKP